MIAVAGGDVDRAQKPAVIDGELLEVAGMPILVDGTDPDALAVEVDALDMVSLTVEIGRADESQPGLR
jgi:hypothetical protein